jgi:hypothetical protein
VSDEDRPAGISPEEMAFRLSKLELPPKRASGMTEEEEVGEMAADIAARNEELRHRTGENL